MKHCRVFYIFSPADPISNSGWVFQELHSLPNCFFFPCEMIFEKHFSPALIQEYFLSLLASSFPLEVQQEREAGGSRGRGFANMWIPCFLPPFVSFGPVSVAALGTWIVWRIYSPAKMLKAWKFSAEIMEVFSWNYGSFLLKSKFSAEIMEFFCWNHQIFLWKCRIYVFMVGYHTRPVSFRGVLPD